MYFRFLISILLLCLHLISHSQNTPSIAVIKGEYEGCITKKSLLKVKKIKLHPKNKDFKIVYYLIEDANGPFIRDYGGNSANCHKSILLALDKMNIGEDITIRDIVANNKKTKDTINLNAIHFVISEKDHSLKKSNARLLLFANCRQSWKRITKSTLLSLDTLKTTNPSLKIESFQVQYYYQGQKLKFNITSNVVPEGFFERFRNAHPGYVITYNNIICSDNSGRKYYLAPETFKVVND